MHAGSEPSTPLTTVAALARRIRDLASTGDRVIIGISGPPGAGKSTLAALLQGFLGEHTCLAVPMDGFHLASSVLAGTELESRRGAIDTFDVGGFLSLMRRIKARDEDVVYAPSYAREIEDPIASAIPIDRTVRAIIVEGNYLLSDEPGWIDAQPLFTEMWFIDIDEETRMERLIARHVEFGRTHDEAVRWASGSDLDNARYIQSLKPRADLQLELDQLFEAQS